MLLLLPVAWFVLIPGCGDNDSAPGDARISQIGGITETAVDAWASAGPDGLYDYLASSVTGRCSKARVAQALASREQPSGFGTMKNFEFTAQNQASGTVVLLTKAGNKEETWLYSEEGSSWRITNLPGLEGCAQ